MLNSTAAARKHIVATTPATTGRASPSSGNSAGGKGSGDGSQTGFRDTDGHDFRHLVYFFAEQPTCAGDSHYITAFTDQVDHDSHHSKLIPGILPTKKPHRKYLSLSQVAWLYFRNMPTTDLNKVSSDELGLSRWDEIIQNFPPLPKAELHDVSIDGRGVVRWREPGEENTVLRAIGCEAPWWSKKHQWFWST